MTRQYKDIAEFGHSMHHLFTKMAEDVEDAENFQWFAKRQVEMSHLKGELRQMDDYTVSPRDVEVFRLAMAMAQRLMVNQYAYHTQGSLTDDEIFPVPVL